MSIQKVIIHIEKVLNTMGNQVQISVTGSNVISQYSGHISIDIKPIKILNSFNTVLLPTPKPQSSSDANSNSNSYYINRIRLSDIMINDYSKNYPYSDNDLLDMIKTKGFLFGFY